MDLSSAPELESFVEHNPGFDILTAELLYPVQGVDWGDLAPAEVLPRWRVYQRLLRIEPDMGVACVLGERGIDSAHHITSLSRTRFVGEFAESFAGGARQARRVYDSALVVRTRAMHLAATVHGVVASRSLAGMRINNTASIASYFQGLASYQEMFGSLDYCECAECGSIFGPAAYLVDLLRIVDLAITQPNTTRTKDKIPVGLSLEERRPDLSRIALTCANTNDEMPYLRIVNRILEQTVRSLGDLKIIDLKIVDGDVYQALARSYYPFVLPFHLPLTRIRRYLGAVGTSLVEVYAAFASAPGITAEQARELLTATPEQFQNIARNTSLAPKDLQTEVCKDYQLAVSDTDLCGLDRLDTFAARVGVGIDDVNELLIQNLSAQELFDVSGTYQITQSPGTTLVLTQDGDAVTGTYTGGTLAGVMRGQTLRGTWQEPAHASTSTGRLELTFASDGASFTGTRSTGLDPQSTTTDWNGSGNSTATVGVIPRGLFVNRVLDRGQYLRLVSNPAKPDQPTRIEHQCVGTLDTLSRFVRLARVMGWSWWRLDWALATVQAPGVRNGIVTSAELTTTNLVELAKLTRLVDEYGVPFDLATTLSFDLRTIGRGTGPRSEAPFDLVINSAQATPHYPGHKPYRPKIAPGLTTSWPNPLYQDTPLTWAVTPGTPPMEEAISAVLGSIPASYGDIVAVAVAVYGGNATVELTVPVISVLYRHTMLAQHLGLAVGDYFTLLRLLGCTTEGKIIPVLSRDQALEVLSTAQWLADVAVSLDDLAYFACLVLDPPTAGQPRSYDPAIVPSFLASLDQILSPALVGATTLVSPVLTPELAAAVWQALLNQGVLDPAGVVVTDIPVTDPPFFSQVVYYAPGSGPVSPAQESDVRARLAAARTQQRALLATQLATLFAVAPDTAAILASAAATWSGQHDVAPYLSTPLFDAWDREVLVDHWLDSDKIKEVFRRNGIILSDTVRIDPRTVTSWSVMAQSPERKDLVFHLVTSDLAVVTCYADAPGPAAGATRLFDLEGSTVLTGATLEASKVQKAFQDQGITLADTPPLVVTPRVRPWAWLITDVERGKTYHAWQPGGIDVVLFFRSSAVDAPPEPVTVLLNIIDRLQLLSIKLALPAPVLAVVAECPAAFDIIPPIPPRLTLAAVRAVRSYAELSQTVADTRGGLGDYLRAAQRQATPADALLAKLCGITGWNLAETHRVCEHLFGVGTVCRTAAEIDRVARVFALSARTNLDAGQLADLHDARDMAATPQRWPTLTRLADTLLQACRVGVPEKTWTARAAQLDGPVQASQRDALVPTALWGLGTRFSDITTPRALYEYLLLDVEMSDCAHISVIKEALNAAQLYLQRCRLHLERNVVISTDDLPETWWRWLLDFRIWQANRKIFLYPENYLDPGLRSTKTQLFTELEDSLLQGPVTEERVDAVFRTYLDHFAELAQLVHVDSYHTLVHDPDHGVVNTLFLFARSATQPYHYYCATRQQISEDPNHPDYLWSQWEPFGITINSAELTPLYAFNKLFVFWVELTQKKEPTESGDASKRYPVTLATVRFSYRNFSGDWVQPQTLLDQHVINAGDSELYKNIPVCTDDKLGDLFALCTHPDRQWWHKVAALRVLPTPTSTEKIYLYYGPLINYSPSITTMEDPNTNDPGTNDPGTNDPSGPCVSLELATFPPANSDGAVFLTIVRDGKLIQNQIASLEKDYQSSSAPLHPVLVLDENLGASSSIWDNQYPMFRFNQRSRSSAPTLRPGLNGASLVIHPSRRSILDDYLTGTDVISTVLIPQGEVLDTTAFVSDLVPTQDSQKYFTALKNDPKIIDDKNTVVSDKIPSATDLASRLQTPTMAIAREVRERLLIASRGAPVLFSATDTRSAAVIPTRNQPGSFLFHNENETFLLEPVLLKDFPILLKDTPLHITLKGEYFPMLDASLKLHIPPLLVTPTVFVTRDIDATTSRHYFTALQNLQFGTGSNKVVISGGGRVDQTLVNQTPAKVFAEKMAKYNKTKGLGDLVDLGRAQQVREILRTRSSPILVTYDTTGSKFDDDNTVLSWVFRVSRLSTNAVSRLGRALDGGGVAALLSLSMQQQPLHAALPFDRLGPTAETLSHISVPRLVPPSLPYGDQVDFGGPYGVYYWELFFHAPWLVASMLRGNQQFRAAERWLKFIFDPTAAPDPLTLARFTQLLPDTLLQEKAADIYQALTENKWVTADGSVAEEAIDVTVATLAEATQTSPEQAQEIKNLLVNRYLISPAGRYWQFMPFRNHTLETLRAQLCNSAEIAAYNNKPFDPHAIARLRIGAYEKAIVMAYIGNVLDWADQEFTRYSWESITTARMLYSYAYDLLGPRPVRLGPCTEGFPTSFQEILTSYGSGKIPQFLIDLENALGTPQAPGPVLTTAARPYNDLPGVFCIPENEQFLALWDRIEDRLGKIRRCLTIEGKQQTLALFEPPLNPAALVKAAATTGSVEGLRAALAPQVPHYRFAVLADRAEQTTELVRSFGAALLGAFERRDSEHLAVLRSAQERVVLTMISTTQDRQIEDLTTELAALRQGLASAQYRTDYYTKLISAGLNAAESATLTLMAASLVGKTATIPIYGLSIAGYLAPNIFGLADGGMQFGDAINAGAQITSTLSELLNQSATIAQTVGQNQRRAEEWELQRQLANYESEQLTQQIAGVSARIAAAHQDKAINSQEIIHAEQVHRILRDNFTNEELYRWMASRTATVYFQAFRLAHELALAAQTAYQFELGRDEDFLALDSWDTLHQGLLAGEGLQLALHRMRTSYLDHHHRRLEIEKTISLRNTFPAAFLGFIWGHRVNDLDPHPGRLDFTLSQQLFDLDYPGHYDRRITAISISIPSVIGPYQDFHATLTQNSDLVVRQPDPTAITYALTRTSPHNGTVPTPPVGTIRENWVPRQQIAVSRGVDDTGLFTLNFSDDRYLPFEGTGAVSSWSLSLPPETNRLDFTTISDVILKVRYTARDAGTSFQSQVRHLYQDATTPRPALHAALINLSQSFSSQWAHFLSDCQPNTTASMMFRLPRTTVLPNLTDVHLHSVLIQLNLTDNTTITKNGFLTLQIAGQPQPPQSLPVDKNIAKIDQAPNQWTPFTEVDWTLAMNYNNTPNEMKTDNKIDPKKLLDIAIVALYSARPFGVK
jgi:Tc toxin complex TcA C-terminal TcB-binding domain/Neuraminidase-like domain/Salmonella virulence plasmid 28.1kDa A protein